MVGVARGPGVPAEGRSQAADRKLRQAAVAALQIGTGRGSLKAAVSDEVHAPFPVELVTRTDTDDDVGSGSAAHKERQRNEHEDRTSRSPSPLHALARPV